MSSSNDLDSSFLDSASSNFSNPHSSNPKQVFPQNPTIQNQRFTLDDIDNFVFYDKPFLSFERILETYFATAPKGFFSFIKAIPLWLSTKLFLKETIARELVKIYAELYPHKHKREVKNFKQKVLNNLYFAEHHISHLSAAFFPSPFESAGILSIDGVGEWATTTIAKGSGNHIEILREINFPHSLGLLYSAFTYYLGFKVNSGEYKVMGLAPYGEPTYKDLILENLIDLRDDGSFALNMDYFDFLSGLKMTNAKFDALFGGTKRESEGKLEQIHFDIAASIQAVTNEIMLRLARTTAKITNSRNLCLSGGVALNCVGNGIIYDKLVREEKLLDSLWIQPASGDAGSALGCAYALHYMEFKNPRIIHTTPSLRGESQDSRPNSSLRDSRSESKQSKSSESKSQGKSMSQKQINADSLQVRDSQKAQSLHNGLPRFEVAKSRNDGYLDSMQGAYLGLSYSNDEVRSMLKNQNAVYEKHDWSELKEILAQELASGKVVGFHQGRCEFGPRALGARSILGDSRNPTMQKTMNLKIKYRESFRPFAPSVLDFAIREYFALDCASPYMLLVAPVAESKCYKMSEAQEKLFGIEKLNVQRSEIPAVTHIDYSARVQSVHKATNPRYYELIKSFYALTNCPVLVNTSFNVRGEPIVCAPLDSYSCFMGTQMDILAIEDFLLYKSAQPQQNLTKFQNVKDRYELD
ncbi:carbamoyltransferase family protein [Helicobacter sp. T3_23-1056]